MLYRTLRRLSRGDRPTYDTRGTSIQRQGNVLWLHGYRTAQCPVCSSSGTHKLVLSVPSLIPPHEPLIFVRCRQCDVRFALDYQAASYAAPEPDRASLHFYVEQGAGLEFLARSLFTAAQFPVRRYLDVGCGFGFALDMATRIFGWDARGIDPGPLAASGRKMLGVRIDGEMLVPGEPREEGPFDAIAATEVLEHLTEPHSFLRAVRENLSPSGVFVLSTPNGRYIDSPPNGELLLPVLSPGYHAVLYTAMSLKRVLDGAGFRCVRITESEPTLVAVATPSADRQLTTAASFDQAKYMAYLRSRFRNSPKDSPLYVGAGQRLLRMLADGGMSQEASAVFEEVRDVLASTLDLDLKRPLDIIARFVENSPTFTEMPSRYPFCLGNLLYSKAILESENEGDRDGAAYYFLAARVAADATLKVLKAAGMSDGDTAAVRNLAGGGLKALW